MRSLRMMSATALSGCLAMAAMPAFAQDQDQDSDIELEEVVVTGTYLGAKSQFNSASPITSIGATDLKNIGAANFADLVQTLTINAGAQNNPDAFTQNGTTGTSNFNLRGLGVASTLVLLNGRRQVNTGALTNDGVTFVDVSSLIPQIATKRVEIVKDGAAALYGTDAVAGVVNFITDNEFEGFEFRARGSMLTDEGSQEDVLFEGKYGIATEAMNFMVAASYYDRTGLTTNERRLSRREDDSSLLGNPGAFFILGGAVPVIDPTGCSEFGGNNFPIGGPGQAALDANSLPFTAGFCQFDFGDFFNLVPEEERINIYSSIDFKLGDWGNWRTEVAYADTSAIRGNSPTFPFLQLGAAVVPTDHPNNPFPAALGAPLFFGRAVGNGGQVSQGTFDSETLRISTEFHGRINDDWEFDLAYTYADNDFFQTTEDVVTARFAAALQGLGGTECSGSTPGANGCEYFKPFSTSFTTAPNSQSVIDDVIRTQEIDSVSELKVLDAVFSGTLAEMPAGELAVAIGFQYREEVFGRDLDDLSNDDAFAFVIGGADFEQERDSVAVFIETIVPLAEGLELQAAARWEDYGGTIGDTIDPKIALLWQPIDALTLRGSFSTSFRAPSVFQQFGQGTSLNQVADPVSGGSFFAAVRNPVAPVGGRDLSPEQSEAINIGASFSVGGFNIDVDFWNYDFSDVIIQENFQAVINANPNDPDRIVRATADPGSPILFVFTDFVNASSVNTNGWDVSISYDIETDFGNFRPFVEGTYVLTYDINDPQSGDVDGEGNRNFTNFGSPAPELRMNAGFSWNFEDTHMFRAYGRYISSYDDDQNPGEEVGSMFTVDAQYVLGLGRLFEGIGETSLTIGVINAFDRDPPQVFTNGGFDARTHDPRGRVAYLELSTRF